MCGIVAYVGEREATPILIGGLRRLEYRGYDSAGVAVANGARSRVRALPRQAGGAREALVAVEPPRGNVGIGHTRWATHGRPSDANAHPHSGGVAVVHNGIIENHLALRAAARAARGARSRRRPTPRSSPTSSTRRSTARPAWSRRVRHGARRRSTGAYAHRGRCRDAARARSSPPRTRRRWSSGSARARPSSRRTCRRPRAHPRRALPGGGERSPSITRAGATHQRPRRDAGRPRARSGSPGAPPQAEKDGYKHFMLKEIHEQPRAVADTLRGRVGRRAGDVVARRIRPPEVRALRRIVLLACGTSYHAGLVGSS